MNLKELSAVLGLSQTTVSRALNGYPEVSEKTRKRVADAALHYGYSPNTKARSLATGRSFAVGHIIPLSRDHELVNPIFADFIAGASEVYARENYDMHLSIVADEDEKAAYDKLRTRKSVDGVVVHGPRLKDPRIALLREMKIPFVVHGRSQGEDQDSYPWVDVDNTRSFERATHYLLELGHRRIALLNGLESMDFAFKRRAGYERALQSWGITPDPALCRSAEMTEEFGYRMTRELLAQENAPTAFLASSILIGYGIRRALDDLGLKIGRDISVMIHDDDLSYLRNGGDVPIYTAMRSSVRQAGRICGDLLMQEITAPQVKCRHVLLRAELVIGQTTHRLRGNP